MVRSDLGRLAVIVLVLLTGCQQSSPPEAPAPAPSVPASAPAPTPPRVATAPPPASAPVPSRPPVPKNGGFSSSSAPKANGGGKTHAKPAPTEGMAWNIWAEVDGVRAFKPAPFLAPNTQYRLSVDLAGLVYDAHGVSVTPAGPVLRERVDAWRREGATEVRLQLVALHDPAMLEVLTPAQPAVVKLDRVGQPTGVAGGADVFVEMRAAQQLGTDPKFLYSRSEFTVATRAARGLTAVTFSVWTNDNRPVEEFSSLFCIARHAAEARSACGNNPLAYTLSGVDTVRLAMEGGAPPDAAIHIVEIPGPKPQLVGVFRQNSLPAGTWRTWRLRPSDSGASLAKYVTDSVMPAFHRVSDPMVLGAVGRGFYNVLFPANDPDLPDADDARKDFETFVGAFPQVTGPLPAGKLAPSIFVRAVVPNLDLYLPLGLAHVGGNFIGFSFRVEAPLPVQSLQATDGCITRWTMALPEPSGDTALDRAVGVVKDRFGTPNGWNATTTFYRNIGALRQWLADPARDLHRTALVVTSHHDKDTLFFQENDRLFSREIARQLAPASLAVLNGCGTGQAGATDFIAELSRRGVATVIATATEVQGEMAGWFLRCLADTLDDAGARRAPMTMAELHFTSMQCLRRKRPDQVGATAYEARALSYLLLGNTSLTLCSPRGTP